MSMKRRALLAAVVLLAGRGAAEAVPPAEGALLKPTRYELELSVDFKEERISGSARITLANAGASPAREASFLLYRLMTVTAVRGAGGEAIPFRQAVVAFEDEPRRQTNHVLVALSPPLQPGKSTIVRIEYGGYLAGYVETGSLYIKDRVDEAFTIIREDADAYPTVRVPSFAGNRAAGLPEFEYLARINVPEAHVVANGGALIERTVRDGRATYVYRNIKPAWRMDFAVARFGTLEAPGLRVFHLPEDRAGAERVMKAAGASMALYKQWFGPLHGAPAFTIIEIPDGWGSQADVSSILQAAAAFRDPARLHEVYHEISHLWNAPSLDRPFCRWNEGLASFLEDLTQEKLGGAPALDKRAENSRAAPRTGRQRAAVEVRPDDRLREGRDDGLLLQRRHADVLDALPPRRPGVVQRDRRRLLPEVPGHWSHDHAIREARKRRRRKGPDPLLRRLALHHPLVRNPGVRREVQDLADRYRKPAIQTPIPAR